MKRKLWIILALAALTAAVWCGTAAADSMAFTVQPSSGALNQSTMTYPITWETNFTPIRVELVATND